MPPKRPRMFEFVGQNDDPVEQGAQGGTAESERVSRMGERANGEQQREFQGPLRAGAGVTEAVGMSGDERGAGNGAGRDAGNGAGRDAGNGAGRGAGNGAGRGAGNGAGNGAGRGGQGPGSGKKRSRFNFGGLNKRTNPARGAIGVVAVGGGGCNAGKHMIVRGLPERGIKIVALNTDIDSLASVEKLAEERGCPEEKIAGILLGPELTGGEGAGADANVGRLAAEESLEEIRAEIEGIQILFLTASMGGGTGTGAAPVVARLAKKMGMIVVGVVTLPFDTEDSVRKEVAQSGVRELEREVDALIILSNDRVSLLWGRTPSTSGTLAYVRRYAAGTLLGDFEAIDDVLHDAVLGTHDLITRPGNTNVDLADVRQILRNAGRAIIGIGHGDGEDGLLRAAERAAQGLLLENSSLVGANRLLVNIVGGPSLRNDQIITMMNALRGWIRPPQLPNREKRPFIIVQGVAIDETRTPDDLSVMVTVLVADFREEGFQIDLESTTARDGLAQAAAAQAAAAQAAVTQAAVAQAEVAQAAQALFDSPAPGRTAEWMDVVQPTSEDDEGHTEELPVVSEETAPQGVVPAAQEPAPHAWGAPVEDPDFGAPIERPAPVAHAEPELRSSGARASRQTRNRMAFAFEEPSDPPPAASNDLPPPPATNNGLPPPPPATNNGPPPPPPETEVVQATTGRVVPPWLKRPPPTDD